MIKQGTGKGIFGLMVEHCLPAFKSIDPDEHRGRNPQCQSALQNIQCGEQRLAKDEVHMYSRDANAAKLVGF